MLKSEFRTIETISGKIRAIVLRPRRQSPPLPGILWIHGGGYVLGNTGMVYASMGKMLAERYGAVVLAPEYRKAKQARYPAALNDCYAALRYMYAHAEELGIDPEKIVAGGESAGGGLAAAVCLLARDRKEIPVAFQIPLYPMLDCEDTESSRDNHGPVWNTRRNHWGWRNYLGELYGTDNVPKYASPSRETDYTGLPPAYTYVMDDEPFFSETIAYIRNLQEAGVDAHVDVYHGNIHAFDELFWTEQAKDAKKQLCRAWERVILQKDNTDL